MEKTEHTAKASPPHRVWVSVEERIASFHEVETYKLQTFQTYNTFISYLHTLAEQGFRFQ